MQLLMHANPNKNTCKTEFTVAACKCRTIFDWFVFVSAVDMSRSKTGKGSKQDAIRTEVMLDYKYS